MVLLIRTRRRDQHGADKVFPRRAGIDLLVDVFEQLVHLFIRPDVLALIVRDDIGALLEGLCDAVFVVFDPGHVLPPSYTKSRCAKQKLGIVTFWPEPRYYALGDSIVGA